MKPAVSLVALIAGLAVAGCATPGQVRRVETRLAMMERENARADSARAAEALATRDLVQQLTRAFSLFVDATTSSLDSVKRDGRTIRGDLSELDTRIAMVGERVGQTQNFQRNLGTRLDELATLGVSRGGEDTNTAATVATADQLFDAGNRARDQMAYGVARASYHELMSRWPESPLIPQTLLALGRSFSSENPEGRQQADSSRVYYEQLITRFPGNVEAKATALFRLADIELKFGSKEKAKALYQRIIKECPNTPEASYAPDKLAGIP